MTLKYLQYVVTNTGKIPRGTNGFFNYGKVAFVWIDFWTHKRYTGATHWVEHSQGIIWPEGDPPDDYVVSLKPGVKVNFYPNDVPIDIEKDIQVGVYIGNLLKADTKLVKLLTTG